jgi:hypothetical protein
VGVVGASPNAADVGESNNNDASSIVFLFFFVSYCCDVLASEISWLASIVTLAIVLYVIRLTSDYKY